MIIDILCNDGSPLGVTAKDLWGEGKRGIGVGGSEYALITMCEEWTLDGHDVTLYNDPLSKNESVFEQRAVANFNPFADRDIVIIFRSPNHRVINSQTKGKKIWWSCDQYTIGDFRKFATHVDDIVTISPFHSDYFSRNYGITNAVAIDLPVRVRDFLELPIEDTEVIPYRCLYASVPDRGLHNLLTVWGGLVEAFPEATLSITSDYRLWGCAAPQNIKYRKEWEGVPNVNFLGAIKRKRFLQEQMQAELLLYPNEYNELFCITVAEAQVAGIYPITSEIGALRTTNMGKLIPGNPISVKFQLAMLGEAMELFQNRNQLNRVREEVAEKAKERFAPERILEEWNEKIFKKG